MSARFDDGDVGISLEQAREECLETTSLPDGYRIDVDCITDNLVVRGKQQQFAIIRPAIDAGYHKAYFAPSFAALVECERTGAPLKLPPIKHASP